MYTANDLRRYYGLSQSDMAVYLSVSVSLLKMVEVGKRELPAAAMLKLAWMQQAMLGVAIPDTATEPVQEEPLPHLQQLRIQILSMDIQVRKNEKELAAMQERYQQALRRATLFVRLRGKKITQEEAEKDELWLDIQQRDTHTTLQQYGKAAQATLQWKTISLLYSMEKLKAFEQVLLQHFSLPFPDL